MYSYTHHFTICALRPTPQALYNALMMSSYAGPEQLATGALRARSRLHLMSNAMDSGAAGSSAGATPQQPHQQQQPGPHLLTQRGSRGGGVAGQTCNALSGSGAPGAAAARVGGLGCLRVTLVCRRVACLSSDPSFLPCCGHRRLKPSWRGCVRRPRDTRPPLEWRVLLLALRTLTHPPALSHRSSRRRGE